jgi:hypothetical protein
MMLDSSREVLFVSAKRTAFGAFGGAFRDLLATDLGTSAHAALTAEIAPVEVGGRKRVVQKVERDEHPRRQTPASAQKVTRRGRSGVYRRRPRYCSDSGIVVIGIA